MNRGLKRITIVLDEDLYVRLVEYTAKRSKRDFSRFSLSESIRDVLSEHFRGDKVGPGDGK